MRCAALQFDVRRDEVARNSQAALELLERAARDGVRLAVLPEMWPTSFPSAATDLERACDESATVVDALARRAAELSVVVCGSSFAPSRADGSALPANRWHALEGGACVASYDKVHLFSPTAEHESFSAGCDAPPVCATSVARLGGLICYDVRFPELTRRLFASRAEIVALSAQWPAPRAAQFRALALGLAVLNQCYVVACNRTGVEEAGRRALRLEFPGNSLIASPSGDVLAEGAGEAGVVAAEVDLELVRELRARVPVAKDQRRELYASWNDCGELAGTSLGF